MAALSSNPNVKVPGASPASSNMGAGYKVPAGAASTAPVAKSPAPTTPAKPTSSTTSPASPTPTTPPAPAANVSAPAAPPASLGTLTDSEQRIWNTLIGDVGAAAATQAVINSRALAAGQSAISSGAAKSVTVAPNGDVTTVTTTPGVTNTGKASATSTGVNTSVPAPKATPVNTDADSYYTISGNGKTVNVISTQYDSWTPAQQFAFQQSQGLIPTDAQISLNTDGSWGYTSKSASAKQQANSGYTNGIPTDLYNTYLQNKNSYAAAGKPPPLNFDHTVDGQVTVTPYADPSKAVTYIVPSGTQLFFNNVKGLPVIDKLTDLKGNIILKADAQGNYTDSDIQTAINSGKLSTANAVALFGTDAINKIMNSKPATSYPSDYDQNDWDADKASGKIPKDATFVSYDASTGQVNFTLPSTYTQDDWDADLASGKIPKGATFVNYDASTGSVNYTVPVTSTPGYIADHPSGGGVTAKSGAIIPVLTPAQAAALLAQEKAASAQVTNAKPTKTGISLFIQGAAAHLKNAWSDIVSAAESYNATHSGIGKIETVNGKQTVVRTAPAAGLPTIGGNAGEELTEAGELEASSGGAATPIVILAVLASVGIAAYSQRQNIENAVTHYKQTHDGQAPTASQVTLTDNTGKSVTLAQVANTTLAKPEIQSIYPGGTPGAVQLPGVLQGGTPGAIKLPAVLPGGTPGAIKLPGVLQGGTPGAIKLPGVLPGGTPGAIQLPSILQATATAGDELTQTKAVGKVMTPAQLEALWNIGGNESKGVGIRHVYYSAESVQELDQIILQAYYSGALTQDELQEYEKAKEKYLKAKAKSDTAVASATNSIHIPKSISKGKFIAAVSAATLAAIATAKATKAQQATAIKQAIYISTGVQTQPAVEQITQTAQQIATQQAVKAGLQTATQQAIKEATQTKTAEQIKEQTQEQTQEQVQEQTRTPARAQAVSTETATATAEAEKAKTAEDEAELENEMTAVIAKPQNKKTPEEAETITKKDLANATTWKAGFGWWYRFPNGQYRFLRQPPPGAKPVKPGKGSGYASVQTIRGQPIVDTRRMGVVTVTINRPAKQPGARGAIAYHATGQGKPGLSMTRKGKMVSIRGVGLANVHKIPRGRVLRS